LPATDCTDWWSYPILYLLFNFLSPSEFMYQWRRQTRRVGCVRTPCHEDCIIFLKQDSALISNSVRLSVYTPVLRQNSFRYTEMVEIISKLDSLIILTFGQLIAVTKFGRRSPLTGPQILERYCSKSQCKGPISEMVQDSYNRRPFKSKIVCPL